MEFVVSPQSASSKSGALRICNAPFLFFGALDPGPFLDCFAYESAKARFLSRKDAGLIFWKFCGKLAYTNA